MAILQSPYGAAAPIVRFEPDGRKAITEGGAGRLRTKLESPAFFLS